MDYCLERLTNDFVDDSMHSWNVKLHKKTSLHIYKIQLNAKKERKNE